MNWKEITIKIPTKSLETAAAIAQMIAPHGMYIEDYSDLEEIAPQIAHINLIDEQLLSKDKTSALIHIYMEESQKPLEAIHFIQERLINSKIEHTIVTETIRQIDWETAWKKYYHPIKISSNLVICPTWENYRKKSNETIIKLDPGMAFGTGTHETTRMCLQLMEKCIRNRKSILDIGCGSGILSIAALMMGIDHAVGCDIDSVAIKVARENALINNLHDRITLLQSNLTQNIIGKFDIICANIVADAIIQLTPNIPKFMNKNAVFITSGIIAARSKEVEISLEENGFIIDTKFENADWIAILCKHSNNIY